MRAGQIGVESIFGGRLTGETMRTRQELERGELAADGSRQGARRRGAAAATHFNMTDDRPRSRYRHVQGDRHQDGSLRWDRCGYLTGHRLPRRWLTGLYSHARRTLLFRRLCRVERNFRRKSLGDGDGAVRFFSTDVGDHGGVLRQRIGGVVGGGGRRSWDQDRRERELIETPGGSGSCRGGIRREGCKSKQRDEQAEAADARLLGGPHFAPPRP